MIIAKDSHGNYVKIEDIKQQDSFKGISPIDFKSNGDNLKNYRIYGNTVNGESVGDLIIEGEHSGEYQVSVTIEGKNLLSQLPSSRENKGIIFTNENNYIHIEGTSTGGYAQTTDVTLSLSEGTYYASFVCSNEIDKSKIFGVIRHYDNSDITNVFSNGSKFTISEPETVRIIIGVIYANSTVNTNLYFQIEKNFIKTSYEPYHAPVTTNLYLPEQIKMVGDEAEYIDFGEQKQHRVRKNLLQNTGTSRTINGVTFTVNSDGSVTCNTDENGATATAIFNVCARNFTLASDNYILSGCPIGGDISTKYKLDAQVFTDGFESWIADIGDGVNIYSDKIITILLMRIVIYKNQVCDNLTFYPMIRKADIEDDTYEPHIENTDLDVTLPALPTVTGTNTLSVNTNIKPSKVWGELNDPRDILYVKDKLGNILFSKYYEIEDEPPLTYKAKKAGTLKNYRIYGQTVDGESVGDRTENLFDVELTDGYHLSEATGFPVKESRRFATLQPITINQSEYCLAYNSTTELRFMYSVFNDDTLIRRVAKVNGIHLQSGDAIDTTDGNKIYFAFYQNDYSPVSTEMISNIMLNEGSTALPYEPYGYKIPVKIEGKNLLQNTATSQIINGVTFTVNEDGSVTCDGQATALTRFNILPQLGGGYDMISGNFIINGAPSAAGAMMAIDINGTGIQVVDNLSYNGTVTRLYIQINNGISVNNVKFYPMIRKANISDDKYEPYQTPVTTNLYLPEQIKKAGDEADYIDYEEQKQHRVRKNLLPNTATSQTINGVTFTVNSDRSITCNGTANASAPSVLYIPFTLPIKLYELSGCPDSGGAGTYRVDIRKNDYSMYKYNGNNVVDDGTGCLFDGGNNQYCIRIAPGYTCNNLTFYPMIRKADIEDDTYEPYITNTELNVTLPSISVPSGINILSVETGVQPSDIYLKGKIEKKPKIYYKIYYYSQDGQTVLSTETVEEGHDCTYSTAPAKESDTDFNYTFTGWSTSTNSTTATAGATENIQQNTNLYAAFSKSFKTDTISDSWEEIIANCGNGTYASKYQIGDLKTIDVGTEGPVQMQIVAIDTDDLADNSGKAPITWISKQLLKTDCRMNPSYQSGTEGTGTIGGWEKTEMRSYLKETVKPLIPETVRNAIKPVKKYSRIYNVSGSAVNDVLTTEDVWIPSYKEVFGSGLETLGPTYSATFPDDASRIKRKAGGSAAWWWLRSADGRNYFYGVYTDGFYYYGYASYTGGVTLGFCT